MKIRRRQFLHLAAGAVALPAIPYIAIAQTYPARPLRVIVPLVAGTGLDIVSRLVLNEVASQLGQPIIIENRPGAGGTIGAAAVAKAEPDGYTILADSSAHTIVPSLYPNLSYDPAKDFLPVIPLGAGPMPLVVSASRGFRTVSDLVSVAKAKPGSLNFGSPGIGSTIHLAAERFRFAAGFDAVHIPVRGGAYLPDLLSGRIDFAYTTLPSTIDLIQNGQLIALAVSGRTRTPLLPDVPTTIESGYPNSDLTLWFGIFVPAKTSQSIVERINMEIGKVLQSPSLREKLAKIGAEPFVMTPPDFDAMIRKEFVVNAALIKSIGLTPN
jgi:tripartite-type tricarboxylate transporter receptor subunit TctC